MKEVESTNLNVLFFPARYPSPLQPYLAMFHREHLRAVSLYHDVMVLDAPREESPLISKSILVERSVEDEVEVVRVHYRRSPIPKTTLFVHLYSVISAYRQILRSGFRPDLIHAHMYFISLAAVVLGKLFRVPVIISEHAECFAMGLPSQIRWETQFAMRMADMLMPDSNSLRKHMESQGIKGRFHVVHNPVDTNIFQPSLVRIDPHARPKRILFVGRLLPVKGVPFMLKGLALLLKDRDDFVLDIVGSGDQRGEYESLMHQMKLESNVLFHGNVSREDIAAMMRNSHCFLLASVTENCPTVLVEALASGLPVVASDVGGVREIVPDNMGIFFRSENPESLAKAVEQMLDNLSSYNPKELAAHARSRFSLEVIGRQVDEMYRKVLAEWR